ncbi:MAG: hypothetical protein D3923_04795 [Candidatus Electrothrix sp. AR3]|nr:hypothetical protein [Candidatus Electrothrix sp. AR3]
MDDQKYVMQLRNQPANESRRNFIKTMTVALGFLAGCKVSPLYAQHVNRIVDPNVKPDFTTVEITVINNMMPEEKRNLSFKYHIADPSGNNNYAVQEFSSTKSMTKFSTCKTAGFFIRDNGILIGDIVIFQHVTSTNLKKFTPFCLRHGWNYISTKQVRKDPVYSLNQYDDCIGPG